VVRVDGEEGLLCPEKRKSEEMKGGLELDSYRQFSTSVDFWKDNYDALKRVETSWYTPI